MEILVDRRWRKVGYCIGRLFVDGVLVANTLEDEDRGLNDSMSERTIYERKVYGRTAIPLGRYRVLMDVVSSKFSKFPFYMEVCGGKLPRLKDVKGFEGILLHVADGPRGASLLEGCIGIGYNKKVGQLCEGKEVFKRIYSKMRDAHERGEEIWIEIK